MDANNHLFTGGSRSGNRDVDVLCSISSGGGGLDDFLKEFTGVEGARAEVEEDFVREITSESSPISMTRSLLGRIPAPFANGTPTID